MIAAFITEGVAVGALLQDKLKDTAIIAIASMIKVICLILDWIQGSNQITNLFNIADDWYTDILS
jgi:hypothetical protein